MAELIYFNSVIKSSVRDKMLLNILSAKKSTSDYIIEYKVIYEKENGEKDKTDNFSREAFLSDFAKKERNFITQMIKLRNAINTAFTETVVAKETIL